MSEPTDDEYDFSNVPLPELESCLYYEYMRESKKIIREVNSLKLQLAREAKRQGVNPPNLVGFEFKITKVTNLHGAMFEGVLFLQLAQIGKFPKYSWQRLPDSDRKRLRDFVVRARRSDPASLRTNEYPPLVIHTTTRNPALGESTLDAWQMTQTAQFKKVPAFAVKECFNAENLAPAITKSRVYGFVQLNTGYTHGQLLNAFEDWLKANHPERGGYSGKPRGRRIVRDRLNALGALRLRYYCLTLTDAQKVVASLAKKANGMSYSDRRAWNRACDTAVEYFHTILKLSKEALPIHYTEGWQK